MTSDHRIGFEPVAEEVAASLPVEGSIPDWLSGTLLRTGRELGPLATTR